jgi:MraZ protein
MPLTGTYSRNLDDKRRLAVPKQLRDEFGDAKLASLFIAPGTDRSLALYSEAAFDRLAQRLADHSPNSADVRNYLRLFYARAERAELDSQGRIRIPERLVQLAELERNVVLLGVHDHAEIWNQDHWESFLGEHSREFDRMASQAFEQGHTRPQ